jgi:hypothetical protein
MGAGRGKYSEIQNSEYTVLYKDPKYSNVPSDLFYVIRYEKLNFLQP